jgi:diguanylate cyclase (GGDEF)-like protein/putative nucleotidyltransferase with HDIG domain
VPDFFCSDGLLKACEHDTNREADNQMPMRAKIYIGAVIALGITCIAAAGWRMEHPWRFLGYLCIAVLASAFKVNLPRILCTLSPNFMFILAGIVDLSAGQTIVIGCAGGLVQCLWRPKHRARFVQAAFSAMNLSTAVFVAYQFYHCPLIRPLHYGNPAALMVTSLLYFFLNTAGIALVVALTEGRSPIRTWRESYFWSFPFCLVGASIAWVATTVDHTGHWQSTWLLVPVIFIIHRSYRMYVRHLSDEKKHVEDIAALHLRTIEALALAIQAKDQTTHEHLCRVRVYAVELGREMKLPESELESLRAAALLHDIGKLAVPEHIICKPGRLTPEEFEKMKIHPVVGAEILDRVEFPYPVAPVVRAHHEKWDGSGYPDGLRGEEIPVGARILAAVDALDALASDRQYRRALPLDRAMREVAQLAGTSFDPAVIELLQHKYVALEEMATRHVAAPALLPAGIQIEHGEQSTAGPVTPDADPARNGKEYDFMTSIAAARQEVQLLFELTQDLGTSLSLDETLSVVAARLKHMVPYDAIAVYVCRGDHLVPEFVNGESFRLLSSLQIPMGEGLSGLVAQTGKAILNGNPSAESGYRANFAELTTLRSAVAVPLIGLAGTIGVLTLYRTEKDAFSSDHLRVLLAISSKVSLAVGNALKFRLAETGATTDYLTNLPNARSLFLRLDSELARCKRTNQPLTVVVGDLDGFKQVNDFCGHLEGNKVLQAVAGALRECCREYDYVARMGGDEFVFILPASNRESMKKRISEFREIGGKAGRLAARMNGMTMSIGEASFPDDGHDAEQLLAEADRRMYQAKQFAKTGRTFMPQTFSERQGLSLVQ